MTPATLAAPAAARVVALAGRPNTGKTTLFNALTGLRQRVANFAGCTVEKASGTLEEAGGSAEVVDLPGTFSLLPASEDERVALGFLFSAGGTSDLRVLVVAEASNLASDLSLALALKSLGLDAALIVNMIDEAEQNGLLLDRRRLEEETGLPVFPACARDGRGLAEVRAFCLEARPRPRPARAPSPDEAAALQISAAAEARRVAALAVKAPGGGLLETTRRSIAVDRWVFHPVAGPALLGLVLFAVFQSLFALGAPAGDAAAAGFARLSGMLRPLLPSELLASLVCDGVLAGLSAVAVFVPQIAILFLLIGLLEASGYLPRAAAMVDRALRPFGLDGRVFIPFLSSFACAIPGIMATRTIASEKRRLTAVLLAPLMTCSARVPVYTLLIAAFVPASFRPLGLSGQGLVMGGMYVFGIAAALALALALRWAGLREDSAFPVAVLPPYRWPRPGELLRYAGHRSWHFLSRGGRVIFTLSVALWALSAFPRAGGEARAWRDEAAALRALPRGSEPEAARLAQLRGRLAAADLEASALGRMGRAIEPVFRPLGYDWRLSIAVLSSLAAREVFVGTMGTLMALGGENNASEGLVRALREARGPDGAPRYTLATAVSLLLFFAVALQCVSTVAIVRRETGSWRWPAAQFAAFFVLAYALAFAGYRLTGLLL